MPLPLCKINAPGPTSSLLTTLVASMAPPAQYLLPIAAPCIYLKHHFYKRQTIILYTQGYATKKFIQTETLLLWPILLNYPTTCLGLYRRVHLVLVHSIKRITLQLSNWWIFVKSCILSIPLGCMALFAPPWPQPKHIFSKSWLPGIYSRYPGVPDMPHIWCVCS